MRNLYITLFVILFFSFLVTACDNNNSNSSDGQTITENDFLNDTSLRADPLKDKVVVFLEPPDAPAVQSRTGEIGTDVFTFSFKEDTAHTFCWEDKNSQAEHFMELDDSDGNKILSVDTNGQCITAGLEAGNYKVTINHDGLTQITHPIFIIPDNDDEMEANNQNSLFESVEVFISNLLKNLNDTITKKARAQSFGSDSSTLLRTNSCASCDLSGADLSGQDLTDANIANSDLSGADLTESDLTNANLAGADLIGATLTDATLTDANLISATFDGATWCDGNLCQSGSTGNCIAVEQFQDNCNGTVSDQTSGLTWEKKDSDDGLEDLSNPSDTDNLYTWSSTDDGDFADGTASTDFLAKLNDEAGGGENCLGNYCDWRLPTDEELESIFDFDFCDPCLDTIFGPASDIYWTASTENAALTDPLCTPSLGGDSDIAVTIIFSLDVATQIGSALSCDLRSSSNSVRAVRP